MSWKIMERQAANIKSNVKMKIGAWDLEVVSGKNLWRFWYKVQGWQTQSWWVTDHWASDLDWITIFNHF